MAATQCNKAPRERCQQPVVGDEIVISGISGKFPKSKNLAEFSNNLYNKIDMIDDKAKRWPHCNPEIPRRMGTIDEIEKFDAVFFGVPYKQVNTMDPQCRLLIETAYEAILDAGISPKSLRGTKTGVYIGACFNESEKCFFYDQITSSGLGITGCSRAMLANRISYCLGLCGPSFLVDTACSSSMYALDSAFSAIRNGECDAALVGGANLLLHPYITLQFARLGVIAKDGYCRPFDEKASGYTRSESICVMYLQKSKDAKRVYANVVYSKTNCDGYKVEGITYPSGTMQRELLSEFYSDIALDPTQLSYVEAHSTGTVVGDPEECMALDNIFCKNRKNALLVGSVKSNMGHTESASGACSIAKVILAFENNLIPSNLNFKSINKDIPSLAEKRMIVCAENTPFGDDLIAINSFGFGGANAHALLKRQGKTKRFNGAPVDDLPRLVNWAGRTEDGVNNVLNKLESESLDAEFIGLLHNIQSEETPGYIYRGFTVLGKSENNNGNAVCYGRATKHFDGLKRPILWVFSGMGSQWVGMGKSLMMIPEFKRVIYICHNTLKPFGIDLITIITSDNKAIFDHILNSFVGIAAIQIALVNVLRLLEVPMDLCVGHSVGELGCAYADGTLTIEQTILSAYARGLVSVETKVIEGSMAAVGLGYEKLKPMLPPTIEIACHNSRDSATISGPKADVTAFVAELKAQGVFAKEVLCSNIPYHSRYIAEMGPKLLKLLCNIIPKPCKRSSKWLSTSVLKENWDSTMCQYSSAEYHTNNLLNAVLFEETTRLLPRHAITLEIAPHGLLQAIIKRSMPDAVHISLTQRDHSNNTIFFLNALGNIFLNGYILPIERLYPKIEFPVSRGTPMISPLIKWDHSIDWFCMKYEVQKKSTSGERKVTISLDEYPYIAGHIIDGRCILPATTYLELAWETLSLITTGSIYSTINVEFEDIRFHRATSVSPGQNIDLTIMIHYGSGKFEITENSATVVSGVIRIIEPHIAKTNLQSTPKSMSSLPDAAILSSTEFYKELSLRGYHYADLFRSITEARDDGLEAKIKWNNNWPAFMDCLLQLNILATDSRLLRLPTRIRKICVNAMKHTEVIGELDSENPIVNAYYDPVLRSIKSGGVEIYQMDVSSIVRRKPPGLEVLDEYKFIPLTPSESLNTIDSVRVIMQLILENSPLKTNISVLEIDSETWDPIISIFHNVVAETPMLKAELSFLTNREIELDYANVKHDSLSNIKGNLLTITSTCLKCIGNDADEIFKSIEKEHFLLCRQFFGSSCLNIPSDFVLLSTIRTDNESLLLFKRQKNISEMEKPKVIEVLSTDSSFQWLAPLKESIKTGPVLLVSQNDPHSGLIGLVNCLRREPNGQNVKCVIISDRGIPKFSLDNSLFNGQLKLGLTINVYQKSTWGTYRFLKLKEEAQTKARIGHFYANVQRLGDLSSFKWFTGYLTNNKPSENLVNIHYSAINFRDVMLATGRLPPEAYGGKRTDQDCLLGLEYSGITATGERVMGMVEVGAMATQIKAVDNITWTVPNGLTLREAATIPVVYVTVYYAFFLYRPISRGKSILIHAGSGGVGLAAIRVALAYGLEVYTTVSTEQKRNFVMNLFPQLKEENIGNSRDCSFEELVLHRTSGKGVDYVLNSLSDDKLLASARCLGRGGVFLEIGKFDIFNNSNLNMGTFEKETTFRAVFADNILKLPEERKIIYGLIEKDLKAGIILPLQSTVFQANELEGAYRFLSTGKHVGKVLIQLRESEEDKESLPIQVVPKVYCDPEMVYIIAGGLGGFGIELADWLILRGARILTLNSRSGVRNSYQAYRIRLWESYGCTILINRADLTTYQGCKRLLVESLSHGQIGGIFNLAAVLHDCIIENQTLEKFMEVVAPKAVATRYLSDLSRILCPHLQHFVVFSSASGGRGNAGQSNYGMANSIMEQIIEQRARDKLPAKAIQWGAVGEVGLVAEMAGNKLDVEVAGTLQQRISSCLNALDKLLTGPQPIVSSIVVADKNIDGELAQDSQLSLIKSVLKIMGIRDIKTISTNATLAELGMDSLMTVEIKQMLEREFEVFLTAPELRAITFKKLEEMSSTNTMEKTVNETDSIAQNLLFRNFGDEQTSGETILRINDILVDEKKTHSLFVPGIEGVAGSVWHTLGQKLKIPASMLQLMKTVAADTVFEIINPLIQDVNKCFINQKEFYIIGYSYGCTIAMETAKILEKSGHRGRVLLIDGAPAYAKRLALGLATSAAKNEQVENALILVMLKNLTNELLTDVVLPRLNSCENYDSKFQVILELLPDALKASYSENYIKKIMFAMLNRLKALFTHNTDQKIDDNEKIHSPILLVRPTNASVTDIAEDYELSNYANGEITVKYVNGSHITILDNDKLVEIIHEFSP